ncbi:DNA-binding transcriptional regulator, MarR family [Lachnospiraceae bacterium C7]|nr:DNA-binding transcriptional regulator, MarR family [Lachnospiraceae bacterium C7]
MSDKYESLKLENQLCFPLYACSKEIVRRYKPYLEKINLTYTQYLTMMVLWEQHTLNVKKLGECLFLDSGTLTPVLKKLEAKGLVSRVRSKKDERSLDVSITEEGMKLREEALDVPEGMKACINLNPEESKILYKILYQILGDMN